MAQGYTKLFQEIVTSTIWQAPNNCRVLWVTMLALKDRDHICRATVPFLAKACDISVEECQGYIDQFCQPDPHSRSKNDEGRRIIQVDEGFFIINGEKYRNLLRHEERKEYVRQKVAEHRARKKDVNSGKQSNLGKPISDTDTDTDTDTEATQSQNPVSEANASETPSLKILPDKQEHTTEDSSSSVRRRRKPKPDGEAKTHVAWVSYAAAYIERYGVEPVRNAKVSAQLSRFVDRVGREDAGRIAAFYVRSNAAWYVKKGHSVGVMLDDAEKLATEWRTGQQITDAEAREKDGQQKRGSMWKKLIEEATGHEPRIAEGDSGNG